MPVVWVSLAVTGAVLAAAAEVQVPKQMSPVERGEDNEDLGDLLQGTQPQTQPSTPILRTRFDNF